MGCLTRLISFKGRATRSEFWMITLGYIIPLSILLPLIGHIFHLNISDDIHFEMLFLIIFILGEPLLAVSIRRLHDLGGSGWLYLLCLIPLLGQIIGGVLTFLIYFKDGEPNKNNYGNDPKGRDCF
jgi:uncharacterized membrane protein YhaH (DUF805 family)